MKKIQYFMTEDKTNRIVGYTLWLRNDESEGFVTFSRRRTPDAVWEPPITMVIHPNSDAQEPMIVNEQQLDYILEHEGFKFKEVIE